MQTAFLWCAQRQERTMPAAVRSATSLLKFSPSQGRLHCSESPFPQGGWKHSLSSLLSLTHWPFKLAKPPSASCMLGIFPCQAGVWPLLPV